MRPQTFEAKTQKCSACGQHKPVGPNDWLELALGGFFSVCRECTDRRTKGKGFRVPGHGLRRGSHNSIPRETAHYERYMSTERGT